MKSYTTRRFRGLFASLPRHVQHQARQAYRLYRQNVAHPGLHFKRVFADPPMYSARVGIGYRAVGVRDGDEIASFWIGSHAEYDRLLEKLQGAYRVRCMSRTGGTLHSALLSSAARACLDGGLVAFS